MNDVPAIVSSQYAEREPGNSGSAITQTLALLYDAYRDLQSRKLFWVTLALSFLVAGVFCFVGIDPIGIKIFGRHVRGGFNSILLPPADFYKYIFSTLAIPVWLGFLSAVLALIAVGGIFPDAISTGSIDLYLSRPIGRLRLFLTKYVFGLLFTAVQVLIFCVVSFFIIGIRGNAWEAGIFLAVPLVTLFFSYLYCVCVLIGILTRSALAAILITALFWGFLYVVHNTDLILTGFVAAADKRVVQQQRLVTFNEDAIARNQARSVEQRGNMSAFEFQRDRGRELLSEYEQTAQGLHWWRNLVLSIKAPLPKTNETVALMSRWLVRPGALDAAEQAMRERREAENARRLTMFPPTTRPDPNGAQGLRQTMNGAEMDQQIAQDLSTRDLPWIVGTSLGFEVVILSLAAWVFCRRDF